MKAAEAFAAFQDLQDLTQATDEQIASMLVYGCKAGVPANYEDVITEHLLRLFRHMTGVPWNRGWEQGARPDEQFGTTWLFAAKAIGSAEIEYLPVFNTQTNAFEQDYCEVVNQTFEYQFQLDVYGDTGIANRNQLQEVGITTEPRLSAIDVVTRLMTAFGHPRFRSALAEKCLYLGFPAFGAARNYMKERKQETSESHAGVDFYVRARPISSLRSPTYGNVDWGFVCPPDNELFPDPPPPVDC